MFSYLKSSMLSIFSGRSEAHASSSHASFGSRSPAHTVHGGPDPHCKGEQAELFSSVSSVLEALGFACSQYSKYPRLLLCSSLEHDVTRLSACRCVESLSHSSFCVPQRIQTLTVTFCFLVSVTRPRFRAPPRLLVTASSPTARAARGSTTTGSNSTSQLPCWMTSGCIIRHMNSFSLISCIVSFYVLNLLISDNSFLFFFLQNILY